MNKKKTNKALPKIPNKAVMDQNLKDVLAFIKSKGINGFILLFQPVDGLTIFHIADMKVRTAFALLMTGFDQVIQLELEKNPNSSKEYKQSLEALLLDFNSAVKKANEKLDAFR